MASQATRQKAVIYRNTSAKPPPADARRLFIMPLCLPRKRKKTKKKKISQRKPTPTIPPFLKFRSSRPASLSIYLTCATCWDETVRASSRYSSARIGTSCAACSLQNMASSSIGPSGAMDTTVRSFNLREKGAGDRGSSRVWPRFPDCAEKRNFSTSPHQFRRCTRVASPALPAQPLIRRGSVRMITTCLFE